MNLRLQRFLPAPPERVFTAFVDPAQLATWWGPTGFSAPAVELDVSVGGAYRITMQPPQGEPFHLRGRYLEIDPPRRLVFSFEWEEPDPDDQPTVATLELGEAPNGTVIALEHGPFATAARQALHDAGWAETLDRLEQHLTSRTSAPEPE